MSLAQLFCILLTKTVTKRAVAWVGSVQPECTVSLGTWKFPLFLRLADAATGDASSMFYLFPPSFARHTKSDRERLGTR